MIPIFITIFIFILFVLLMKNTYYHAKTSEIITYVSIAFFIESAITIISSIITDCADKTNALFLPSIIVIALTSLILLIQFIIFIIKIIPKKIIERKYIKFIYNLK